MAIVEVRPIKKEKWHGKEGKDSFTAPKTVEALVSLRTRRYSTGLSNEDRENLQTITGHHSSDIYIQKN